MRYVIGKAKGIGVLISGSLGPTVLHTSCKYVYLKSGYHSYVFFQIDEPKTTASHGKRY